MTDAPPQSASALTSAAHIVTNVLIVGSTSGIARAMARQMVADALTDGRSIGLVLAARDQVELDRQAADLRVRGGGAATPPAIVTLRYDAADLDTAVPLVEQAASALPGGLQGVILAHGWLPDGDASREDPKTSRTLIDINYTSMVLLLEAVAKVLKARQSGFICCISSVAGDRGRRGSYPYGATKAGLSAYLQGLRHQLYSDGISVLTVKPGYVDTAMIWGMVPPTHPLNTPPEKVAGDILRAMRRGRNIIYTPWYWRIIMRIVTSIPEELFKRLGKKPKPAKS